MFNDTQYIASFKATKVIDVFGDIYDSAAEFRFAELLDLYDVSYEHNTLRIQTPKFRNGFYKPDYVLERQCGLDHKVELIDIKGKSFKNDPQAQELAQYFLDLFAGKTCTSFPSIIYSSFSLVFPEKIQYYDKNTTNFEGDLAHLYRCEKCGKLQIRPIKNKKCLYCGSITTQFVKGDKWLNYVMENADASTIPPHTQWEKSTIEKMKKRGKELRIPFEQDEDKYRIAHPDRFNVIIKPDFAYCVHPHPEKVFGTASKLQSFVYVIEHLDDAQHLVQDLTRHAMNKESVIGQAVFITKDGIYVAERDTLGRNLGGIYYCDHCGKGYFARENTPECPLCGNKKVTKMEKGMTPENK